MKFLIFTLSFLLSNHLYAQENIHAKKIPNKDKITVLDSSRGSNYALEKYASFLNYDVIILGEMLLLINGKQYLCSGGGGGGGISCIEVKNNKSPTSY